MHVLEEKIDSVRRRARRLLLIYGISSIVSVALAAMIALASIDYLVKFEDHGVRLIFSLAMLAALVWATYYFLWRNLQRRLKDVAIAQHVERQFPQLGDRLSTSVEFLKHPEEDVYAGSAALRRAVVTTTTADAEPLDFMATIERRPTNKALRIASLLVFSAVALAAANPLTARVAIARLARPLGNDAWPRSTNFQIVGEAPTRLAVGQTFELNVRDRDGRLPDEAMLNLRFDSPDGEAWGEERAEPMQRLNDTMIVRQDNVTRPFYYRVTGGDDNSMDWIRLEVVEPPRVQSLKVTLQPPAYTGWPAVSSGRQIHALCGTQVSLTATTTKKLGAAELVQENGNSIVAKLSSDGYTLTVPASTEQPFLIEKSGAYWLKLTDEEGLVGGTEDRWEIHAVTDGAPSVAIEQPISNQFVTHDAEIPLRVLVKDDIAVHDVELHVSRSAESGVEDVILSLFRGSDVPPADTTQKGAAPQRGEIKTVEYAWQLASLGLKPGNQLTIYASANDYVPQIGKSSERRITIITPQELEDRIAQRQALILSEISRALKLQQETRGQVGDLQIQLDRVGQLAKQDVDHAQGAELNQRVISGTLTSEDRGVPSLINDLLAELKANRVDNPDVKRRMDAIQQELHRLTKDHLGPVEQDLTAVIKNAQSELANPKENAATPKSAAGSPVDKALSSAAGHQDEVIRSLETMLGELSQWDSYRRFSRDISQLKREQEELEAETVEVGAKTFGKDRKDLPPQEQADLNKLSERQRELARRFDKTQQQMAEMAQSLEQTEPLPAATLGDAAKHAGERGVSGQMRRSGQQLDENQVGQARQQQQQIRRELDELLNILANRREQELSRLVKKLKEAEQQLQQMRKQQDGLRKQIADAEKLENPEERRRQLERLSRQQKQLQEEASRFARQLERLQAEKAGRKTQSAASKMGKGEQAGQKGDGGEAGEQAEQAQKDLDDAQQQLAERRQEAELDLAREQIAKLQDGMKSLGEQQQSLLAETERLETLRATQGRFSRSQLMSVRDLGRAQRNLESECKAMAEKVASAEVFHLALETTSSEMGQAGAEIERQQTGQITQDLQQNVIHRIEQLLTALSSAKKQAGQGDQGGGGGGGGGGQQAAAQDSIRALAEVKLLKLMQEDLGARFQQLVKRQGSSEDFDRLSAEQGKLADLMQNFTRPETQNPEDDPESLPDLRLEEMP